MSQGLFTAVSGIRVNQTRLAVISNNLANVNTIAFKGSAVNFKTVFADTLTRGTAPTATTGGVNPMQIGNGAAVSNVSVNHNQGGSISTGRSTDFLISGEGYFTLERVNSDGTSGYSLSRAGNFSLDANGNLVSPSGNSVLGTRVVDGNDANFVLPIHVPRTLTIWRELDATTGVPVATWVGEEDSTTVTSADMSDPSNTFEEDDVELLNFNIGNDGAVTATYSNGDRITVQSDEAGTSREIRHQTADGVDFSESAFNADGTLVIVDSVLAPEELQLRLATVTNPDGLTYAGNNNWEASANSGSVQFGIANNGSRGAIEAGALESSNVDIAMEFTNMIVAQRGLEAASKVVSVQSDILRTIIGIV